MKLSHLKNIIKEQLQQLRNQPKLMREDTICPSSVKVNCAPLDGYQDFCYAQLSSTDPCTYDDCCNVGGMSTGGRGVGRAPMRPAMG